MSISYSSTTSCQLFSPAPRPSIIQQFNPFAIEINEFRCIDYRAHIEDFTWKLECQARHLKSNASLDALRMLFRTTRSQDPKIQSALYKKDGYFSRWYAGDSDWMESRTSLGKVTDLFQLYLYKEEPKLDAATILNANKEAKKLLGKKTSKARHGLERYEHEIENLRLEIKKFHENYSPGQIISRILAGNYSSDFDLIQPSTVEKLGALFDRAYEIAQARGEPTGIQFIEYFMSHDDKFDQFYKTYYSRSDILSQIEQVDAEINKEQTYFDVYKELTVDCNRLLSSENPLILAQEMMDSFSENNQDQMLEKREAAAAKFDQLEEQLAIVNEQLLFDHPREVLRKYNPNYARKDQLTKELDENKKIVLDSMKDILAFEKKSNFFSGLSLEDESKLQAFVKYTLDNINKISPKHETIEDLKIQKQRLEVSLT